MQRALFVGVVPIFACSLASSTSAQSFDYAERQEYRDESRNDARAGRVALDVSSYEDSVQEIPERTVRQSYATETLAADGTALAMVGVGFAAPTLWLLGGGIYLLGAPVVHLGHARPLTALASLGLRMTIPMIAGLSFSKGEIDDCGEDALCLPKVEFVAGFAVGMGFAMLIDATKLANEEVPVRAAAGTSITPFANVTRTSASAGLGGVF